jgi:hypothetical protein
MLFGGFEFRDEKMKCSYIPTRAKCLPATSYQYPRNRVLLEYYVEIILVRWYVYQGPPWYSGQTTSTGTSYGEYAVQVLVIWHSYGSLVPCAVEWPTTQFK